MSKDFEQEITDLEHRIDERINQLLKQLVKHLQYHRDNENKWGLVKIMRDNPFKTMAAGIFTGFILSILISGITGKDVITWIVKFFG
jgi:ElaB/YqjD/DUF883 family membrane-anchored ribosome-binding protein